MSSFGRIKGVKDPVKNGLRIFLKLTRRKSLNFLVYWKPLDIRTRSKGAGFRVYYTFQDEKLIILLVAGDKSTQQRDIQKARTIKEEL